MMDGADDNKNKEKANRPKVLVLKWGTHKHRVLINNKDVHTGFPALEAPLPEPEKCPTMMAASSTLPWNLGTRNKTLAVDMEEEEKKRNKAVENCKNINNEANKKRNLKSTMMKKEPTLKLAVPLSKSEIEDDFLKMIGKKPPSRPKKRSRLAQQDVINTTYLGLSLAEIPADRYDVPKPPRCTKKVK